MIDELSVSVGARIYMPLTVEEDPWTDYYEIVHDQFCPVMSFTPRMLLGGDGEEGQNPNQGFPAVVPTQVGRKGSPLTGEILWFLFDLCVHQQYGFYYDSPGWKNLTRDQKRKIASEFETFYDSRRFISNHAGIDVNYNPVGEKILGQAHRSGFGKQFEVVTTGNLLKAVSHEHVMLLADAVNPETGKIEKLKTPCIQIEVWDGKNPSPNPATFNHRTHRHLIHLATNTTPFNFAGQLSKTGPWRVDSFHFFGGRGAPYAVYAASPRYIPLNRVRRLRKSELDAWRKPFYP